MAFLRRLDACTKRIRSRECEEEDVELMVDVETLLEEECEETSQVLLGILDLLVAAKGPASQGVEKVISSAGRSYVDANHALGDQMVDDGNGGVHEEELDAALVKGQLGEEEVEDLGGAG